MDSLTVGQPLVTVSAFATYCPTGRHLCGDERHIGEQLVNSRENTHPNWNDDANVLAQH